MTGHSHGKCDHDNNQSNHYSTCVWVHWTDWPNVIANPFIRSQSSKVARAAAWVANAC